jgi:hypothetical protein
MEIPNIKIQRTGVKVFLETSQLSPASDLSVSHLQVVILKT